MSYMRYLETKFQKLPLRQAAFAFSAPFGVFSGLILS